MKKGWEITTLGEVCDFVRGPFGGSLKKNCFVEKGYAVYEQQNAIYNRYEFRYFIDANKFCEMSRFKVSAGDLIMSCSGTMGKISIVPNSAPEGIINQALLKLTTKKEIINTYLKCYIESETFQDTLKKLAQGVAVENVASVKILKQIPIPIPPIKEQEEIVERLDKGFELIDSLKETAKKNLDNSKELFQSALREELSPKEGWETKTLGGVSNDISYGFTSKSSLYKGNAKYLRITDISQPIIDWDNVPYCEVSSEEFEKYKLIEGDLVIARTGATTGFNKIIKEDVNSVFASYLIRFRLDKSILFPNLIGYCLQSKEWYDYIKIISSGRAAQPGANSKQLSVFNLSFPKSIKEQEEIVNSLDRIKGYCEELEGNYKRVLELCEELKQGLLREAFSY